MGGEGAGLVLVLDMMLLDSVVGYGGGLPSSYSETMPLDLFISPY